jgi:hypothetical protein
VFSTAFELRGVALPFEMKWGGSTFFLRAQAKGFEKIGGKSFFGLKMFY